METFLYSWIYVHDQLHPDSRSDRDLGICCHLLHTLNSTEIEPNREIIVDPQRDLVKSAGWIHWRSICPIRLWLMTGAGSVQAENQVPF